MKVTLLTAHVSPRSAGMWAAIAGLAGALRRVGLRVEILGLADRREPGPVGVPGLPVTTCPVFGPDAFGYSPGLSNRLIGSSPDLVHAQGVWMFPSWASLRWSERTGRSRVISPHGMLDPWALRRAAWKKRAVRRLFEDAHLRGAACLHALTEAEARAIRGFGLRNPICVVPNGVELPRGPRVAGPSADTKTLLFLGRLTPKKGLGELLRAWAAVRRRAETTGWRLVIAGWDEGGHEADLRRLTAEFGLVRSVEFVGPKLGAEKGAAFRSADAFILPSLSEGLPVAVLEAWSYTLPVLMTPACNLPEGFAAGAAVEIAPESAAIADGLHRLFDMSEADRRSMGVAGYRLVEDRFAWPRVAAAIRDVYMWVLAGGSLPSCVIRD